MNRRLMETVKRYDKRFRGGEFIDAYNLAVRNDGIAGTIYSRVDRCNQIFVVVSETDNGKSWKDPIDN